VRSLIVVQRTRTDDTDEQPEISYYLSSLPPKRGCAKNFATLIRGHWKGCEIKNHWVRDHCMREDHTRIRGYNANCTLAALRVCIIVIRSLLYPDLPWPQIQERCQSHPKVALSAVRKPPAK